MRACGHAFFRVALLSVVCLSAGCAHYEYDIVQPPDLRQHVGDHADLVFSQSPLVYRLRSYENHLVIRIQNPTPQPVLLPGGQSYAVDPQGQSHPFPTQTIAPGSFIKFILPPVPPEPVPTGPTIGFGFVVDAANPHPTRSRAVAHSARFLRSTGRGEVGPPSASWIHTWAPPRYLMIGPADEYWEWEGESDVRVSFTFREGDQPPFSHAFVFHRRKM